MQSYRSCFLEGFLTNYIYIHIHTYIHVHIYTYIHTLHTHTRY